MWSDHITESGNPIHAPVFRDQPLILFPTTLTGLDKFKMFYYRPTVCTMSEGVCALCVERSAFSPL